jgi:hypothetical protein
MMGFSGGRPARAAALVCAFGLGAGSAAAQAKAPGKAAAASTRLDLAQPDDAVRAMRKIQSSLKDGEPKTFYFQGNVWSRVPGERDRLLFKYQAMNIRQSKTLSEEGRGYGYRMVSREVLLYQDPQTGEILRAWRNPWTGKEVEVVHIANDPVNMQPTFAQGPRGPYKLDITFRDGWGTLGFDVPLFYKNPMSAEANYEDYVGGTYHGIEMFGFFVREQELLGPGDTAPANVSWARISKFLPWMEMNDRVGYMMFSGHGGPVSSWNGLPEGLRKEIEANYPEYKAPPPLDDDRPNETSWTYFKKRIDKKRPPAAPQK